MPLPKKYLNSLRHNGEPDGSHSRRGKTEPSPEQKDLLHQPSSGSGRSEDIKDYELCGYPDPPRHGYFAYFKDLKTSKHGWKDEDGISIPYFSVQIRHDTSWPSLTGGTDRPHMVAFQKKNIVLSQYFRFLIAGPPPDIDHRRQFTVLFFEAKEGVDVRIEERFLDLQALMAFAKHFKAKAERSPHGRLFQKIDVAFEEWSKANRDMFAHQWRKSGFSRSIVPSTDGQQTRTEKRKRSISPNPETRGRSMFLLTDEEETHTETTKRSVSPISELRIRTRSASFQSSCFSTPTAKGPKSKLSAAVADEAHSSPLPPRTPLPHYHHSRSKVQQAASIEFNGHPQVNIDAANLGEPSQVKPAELNNQLRKLISSRYSFEYSKSEFLGVFLKDIFIISRDAKSTQLTMPVRRLLRDTYVDKYTEVELIAELEREFGLRFIKPE